MLCSWSTIAIALLGWLAAVHGPGLPVSPTELKEAYDGQRVVVCGSSYGIGAEIAYELAKAQARIVLAARSESKLQAVAARCLELGARDVLVHVADLGTREGSEALIRAAEAAYGGIDVLVLNHVTGFYGSWPRKLQESRERGSIDSDLALADRIFRVNMLSYIYLSAHALPALAESGGRIIAVGSAAGRQGLPNCAVYAASKHAVFGFFDSVRHDLVASKDAKLRSITVTTGVLGSFDTESARAPTKGILDHVDWYPPEVAAKHLLRAAARRWREVYVPWEQTRLVTLLYPLMPELIDWAVRQYILGREAR